MLFGNLHRYTADGAGDDGLGFPERLGDHESEAFLQ